VRGGPDNLVYRLPSGFWRRRPRSRWRWKRRVRLAVRRLGPGQAAPRDRGRPDRRPMPVGERRWSKEKLLERAIEHEGHPQVVPSLLGRV